MGLKSRRFGLTYAKAVSPNWQPSISSIEVRATRTSGQRIKRTRLIQTEKYVIAVEVEMVIPADDPSEPCYDSETVQLFREIQERAERGDLTWLTKQGKVYAALDAA